MQPVIGITMSYDDYGFIREGVDYSFIRREYGEQVRAAGGQPVFLDPSIAPLAAAELCDGIVISGGQDIDPALYHQKVSGSQRIEPRERTDWERRLIDACDQMRTPVLGVCYGMQLLNVHYGGTLHQDIAQETGSHLDHGTSGKAAVHTISFERNFLSFKVEDTAEAAARHHQAVDKLAPGFAAAARAEDGIIEAIEGRGHFGIQWHAESDGTAARLYGAFISHCSLGARPIGTKAYVPAYR